jgi:hypothetical protein
MHEVIVVDLKTLQRKRVRYTTKCRAVNSCVACWDNMERAGYELELLYSGKPGFVYRASRGGTTRRIVWFHSTASVASLDSSKKCVP